MRTVVSRAVAASLAVFAACAVTAAPAQARVPGVGQCTSGTVCLWEHEDFRGGFWQGPSGSFAGKYFDNGLPVSGKVSSYKNNSRTSSILMHTTGNCSGSAALTDAPGGYRRYLTRDGYNDVLACSYLGIA
jgi:Peptidase inhibitor family I36